MLFIILIFLIIISFLMTISQIKTERLGIISSLKLELKEKEKEIDNLKNKIKELKYTNDVEI